MMFLRSGKIRVKTYELFSGQELVIAEKIQQRRLQILVHSCLYYEFSTNRISDRDWDKYAGELVQLQNEYPNISKQIIWYDVFKNFDASTGFNLPIRDDWVIKKAQQLSGATRKVEKKKKKVGRLF